MSTYFSIGEIAKMFNISTQTLRLYDKLGILKPSLVKSESGYRYYSIDQFVKLDCIKQCKTIGMSLEEIKILMEKDSSVNSILKIIKKQEKLIKEKINELKIMENQLDIFSKRINKYLSIGFNKIIIVDNEERNYIKYNYISRSKEELEVNFRKVILDAEKKYGTLNSDVGLTISYEDVLKSNKVIFKDLSIHLQEDSRVKDSNIFKLPKGKYLTMYFDDSCFDNRKHYNYMIDYIKRNNIKVIGDFIETAIIPMVNKSGEENTLARLEMLIK